MSTTEQFHATMRQWVEVFMRRSMRDLHRFLKGSDLNMGQYSTLMRLYHDPNCGVSDVGTQLGITNAAASQLVDKLVQQHLVERAEAEHDRRVKQLSLTARGRSLIEESFNARLGWADALAEALPAAQRAAVVTAMTDMIAAAQGLDDAADLEAGR
jgi:DNA-binding MarR family transcriptional regulator